MTPEYVFVHNLKLARHRRKFGQTKQEVFDALLEMEMDKFADEVWCAVIAAFIDFPDDD